MQLHFAELVELFENNPMVGGVNPYTRIMDAYLAIPGAPVGFDGTCTDRDGTAIGCEFEGIDNHSIQCLLQELGVRHQRWTGVDFRIQAEGDPTRLQLLRIIFLNQPQDRAKSHLLEMGGQYLILEAGDLQHAVDDLM